MITNSQLSSFLERIEKLDSEKKDISDAIKEIFAEIKVTGFDTKTVKKVYKLKKMSKSDRDNESTMINLYLTELGIE